MREEKLFVLIVCSVLICFLYLAPVRLLVGEEWGVLSSGFGRSSRPLLQAWGKQ